MSSGSPPRSTRRLRNSAVTMRRPTHGAMDLVTVSTSGSSGTAGNLEKNVVAIDANFECCDPFCRVIIIFPGAAIKLPHMVRTYHMAVVNLALSQRSATMDTNPAERVDLTAGVADGIGVIIHQNLQ